MAFSNKCRPSAGHAGLVPGYFQASARPHSQSGQRLAGPSQGCVRVTDRRVVLVIQNGFDDSDEASFYWRQQLIRTFVSQIPP